MKAEPGVMERMAQESQIMEYLTRHPDFFLHHKALLDVLSIPHAERGAVSLFELTLERQRERIHQMEGDLQQLVDNAARNEFIFRVYTDLYSELYGCTSIRQLWKTLNQHFRERLRITACALWLNQDRVQAKRFDKPYEMSGQVFQRMCLHPMADLGVYFGPVVDADREILFGRDSLVHSMALMRLGEYGEWGFMAFGHADGKHFQSGMDSLLLEQLCRFVTLLLPSLVRHCE